MPFMTITYIRHGFATNSSSMHSILEVEPGQTLPAPRNTEWGESHEEGDEFVVSDRQSRINYLHAMAADAARDAGDWHDEDECYRRYLQLAAVIPDAPLDCEVVRDIHLDFLSGYAVPRKIHSPDMDVDFFKHIVQLVMSENIIIFGDRWGDAQPWEEQFRGRYTNLLGGLNMVSRRVGENEWTLLSLYDGTKYSVAFDSDGRQTATPDTSTRALEMVDVSISNACSRQCPFCYRASVPNGPLANLDDLKALVNGLKEIDVMEMVIGGGEPTEHPGFYRFLKETDFGDLSVSFTTRDLNFVCSLARVNGVEESEVIDIIRNRVKAIGLSVQSADDVRAAERNLAVFFKPDTAHFISNPQMVFHVIPGSGWRDVFDAIIQDKHRLLLLGMKFAGRNADADRKAYAEVLKKMLEDERLNTHLDKSYFRERVRLGVDTKFIVDILSIAPDWIKRFNRNSWSDQEGMRSAFIDLVDGTMSPCSFGGNTVRLIGYDGISLNQAFGQIGIFKPEALERFE